MGNVQQFGFSTAPMPAVARILSRYDRQKVEAFIEVAIGLLDTFDAADDPEEPDFSSRSDGQPGDPGDHEPGGDEEGGAYAEFTSLSASQRRMVSCLITPFGHEDDELTGDEQDGVGAEDEECAWFKRMDGSAGCPVADPGERQPD